MKTVRILTLIALSSAAIPVQAMWLRAGRAIASRFVVASRLSKPIAAKFSAQSKPTISFKPGFFTGLRSVRPLSKGLLLVGAVAPTTAAAYAYQYNQSRIHNFSTTNGRVIIKCVKGDINVEGWNKNELQWGYTKEANSSNVLDKTGINEKVESSHEASFETYQYPHGGNSFARHGYDNPLWAIEPAAKVVFTVKVPRDTNIIAKTHLGNIRVKGITGSIDAQTTSGTINTDQ
jgi:hypothetical protein